MLEVVRGELAQCVLHVGILREVRVVINLLGVEMCVTYWGRVFKGACAFVVVIFFVVGIRVGSL